MLAQNRWLTIAIAKAMSLGICCRTHWVAEGLLVPLRAQRFAATRWAAKYSAITRVNHFAG
jgi:hypothetical protein